MQEEMKRIRCMRWKLEKQLECHIEKSETCNISPDIPFQLADMVKDLAETEENLAKAWDIWNAAPDDMAGEKHGSLYDNYMAVKGSGDMEKLEALRMELFDKFEDMVSKIWKDIPAANKQKYMQRMVKMVNNLQAM